MRTPSAYEPEPNPKILSSRRGVFALQLCVIKDAIETSSQPKESTHGKLDSFSLKHRIGEHILNDVPAYTRI